MHSVSMLGYKDHLLWFQDEEVWEYITSLDMYRLLLAK